jgi:alanyl-tRNA synthetase
MGHQFPELLSQQTLIERVIEEEEASFLRTLATGINLLEGVIRKSKGGKISGKVSGNGTKGISVDGDLTIKGVANNPLIDLTVTGTTYAAGTADESKCRGIKGKGDFLFDGGTIKISATGVKSKAISIDGTYTYKSGQMNCAVDAAN